MKKAFNGLMAKPDSTHTQHSQGQNQWAWREVSRNKSNWNAGQREGGIEKEPTKNKTKKKQNKTSKHYGTISKGVTHIIEMPKGEKTEKGAEKISEVI